jgi:hypothetical protein
MKLTKWILACSTGLLTISPAAMASEARARGPVSSAVATQDELLAPVVSASALGNLLGRGSGNCDACDATACDGPACNDRKLISGWFNRGGRQAGCDAGLGCDLGRGCDSGCDGLGLGGAGLLGFGIIKPSDRSFDDFISPMSNPVFFEDPRNLTEVRFIFLHHTLPPVLGGNSVQVYAAQLRARLTERLSLIVTKDGLIYSQSPLIEPGFADVAAGLKYNLYRDAEAGRLLSVGAVYEIPMGSNRSLQGNGDGEFNFFVTSGMRLGERGHWVSASGLRAPVDTRAENRVSYWSNHFDYRLANRALYAFTEFNWFHWLSSGDAFPASIEGGDIFNLGSVNVTGNDIITQAVGMKAKPWSNVEAGVAYEFPLTERRGVLQDRLIVDLIFRY